MTDQWDHRLNVIDLVREWLRDPISERERTETERLLDDAELDRLDND